VVPTSVKKVRETGVKVTDLVDHQTHALGSTSQRKIATEMEGEGEVVGPGPAHGAALLTQEVGRATLRRNGLKWTRRPIATLLEHVVTEVA